MLEHPPVTIRKNDALRNPVRRRSLHRRQRSGGVPSFILHGGHLGAPDRMNLGTPMSLFSLYKNSGAKTESLRQPRLIIGLTDFQSSEAGRPLDEINHVGCGMYGKWMMGEARPRRNVTGHFAREFELLIRCRSEQ